MFFMLVVFTGIAFTNQLLAIEAGGEYKIMGSASWFDGEYRSDINDLLDLDLYLPEIAGNEIYYSFTITDPLLGLLEDRNASYFTRKLYLRHRFDDFNLTVGRQPVSWSFGSLHNPVDYTPGSVIGDREGSGKYTDALDLYLPLDWNSGLSLLASYPAGFSSDFNKMKMGIRGRFGIEGYDLTINYVQEANTHRNPFFPRQRIGLTIKGDLKDVGIYAAFGHYFDEILENSNSILLGVDYSYNLSYHTRLSMQLEYLGLDSPNLSPVLGPFYFMDGRGDRLDLLSASLGYPIDEFSSLNLLTMVNLDGSRIYISPAYRNTLASDIDFTISGHFFSGEGDRFTALSTAFSYTF